MIIKALKCAVCGDTIFSRARHDFRTCGCGTLSVDGGFDYFKVYYDPWVIRFVISNKPMAKSVEIYVDATQKELYDDWNYNENKYGLIPEGE